MMLLLPCIAYCLLFQILREKGLEWRRAAITTAVFCGGCVALFTEALSLPRLLSRGPLALCWLSLSLASFFYWRRHKRSAKYVPERTTVSSLPDRPIKILVTIAGAIAVLVGIIALF